MTVIADDADVVYLNGKQIATVNMPTEFDHANFAAGVNVEPIETMLFWVPGNLFVRGENAFAVEIRQSSADSSETRFDFELESLKAKVERQQVEATLSKHGRSLPKSVELP
ncbi:MAG: hypothetical protein KDB27_04695 [Planctomycetales bacterium]|nr:hypothetical protein [Planctomycetales bacterium]